MKAPFIYALVDPREPLHLRYVGMSMSNDRRPYDHRKAMVSVKAKPTHLRNWVRKLLAEGVEYDVVILESCAPGISRGNLGERERFHIAVAKARGCRLVNATSGGDGGATRKGPYPPEEVAAMRARAALRRGVPLSEETKNKLRGQVRSPEQVERIRAAQLRRAACLTTAQRQKMADDSCKLCTPEHLEKMNAAKRGVTWTAKRRAAQTAEVSSKISAANKGRPAWNKGKSAPNLKLRGRVFSPETRKKISDAMKASMTEERRALISQQVKDINRKRVSGERSNCLFWLIVHNLSRAVLAEREAARLRNSERTAAMNVRRKEKNAALSQEEREKLRTKQSAAAAAGWAAMRSRLTSEQISSMRREAALASHKHKREQRAAAEAASA